MQNGFVAEVVQDKNVRKVCSLPLTRSTLHETCLGLAGTSRLAA